MEYRLRTILILTLALLASELATVRFYYHIYSNLSTISNLGTVYHLSARSQDIEII